MGQAEAPVADKTQRWKVLEVKEGKTEPNPKAPGNLTKFYVHFKGEDGTDSPDTYWRRKEGNFPQPDEIIYGTISQGQYGPMFRWQEPPADTGGPRAPSQPSSQPQSTNSDDPKQESIERQVAAYCAADVLKNRPQSATPQEIKPWFDGFLNAIQGTTPQDYKGDEGGLPQA
jgi:hypothetical protein